MNRFEGNSNANKKEPEKRKKLDTVTTNVAVKKESEFKKFKQNFFAEDAKTVKGQVFTGVIIPGIQRLITDMVKTGIDVLIYGGRAKDSKSRSSHISYSGYYQDRNNNYNYNKIPGGTSYARRDIFSFNEVSFYDRVEAEEVLINLNEQIESYGMVSVADFYDMIGQSAPYTANKYGWRDLRDVAIISVRGGYSIDLPKAHPLD